MQDDQDLTLTAEENELIERWLERPRARRGPDDLREFGGWLPARRPDLLPKGADDAREYLMRLLGDAVDSRGANPTPARPRG